LISSRKAIIEANLKPEAVDLLIVGTTTPDTPLPSCACLVQKELGFNKAVCFDLAAACAGFVYALTTAHQFLLTGQHRNAVVIGADQITPYVDWTDRSTCILFGDAAGAVVLQSVEGKGIIDTYLGSDGNYADLIMIPGGGSANAASGKTIEHKDHFLKMNGAEVFRLAVRGMISSINFPNKMQSSECLKTTVLPTMRLGMTAHKKLLKG